MYFSSSVLKTRELQLKPLPKAHAAQASYPQAEVWDL